MEEPPEPVHGRVLSIQSHVVYGYVGNKCAVFPLQLMGFDVDPILSVQFSNHTGYPCVKGTKMDGPQVLELMEGLKLNGLVHHSHLLTGYIGTLSFLQAVAQVAQTLREQKPDLIYVCDPVLGDEGALYVGKDLVDGYKTNIVPLATILTPNQFEAELLSGVTIKSESDAVEAAQVLHDMGPPTVVITSISMAAAEQEKQQQQQQQGSSEGVAGAAVGLKQQQQQQGFITLLASTQLPQSPGRPAVFTLKVPHLPGYFTGTGDLLTALLLAWTAQHPHDLATAVEKAVAGLQGVLRATVAAAGSDCLKADTAEAFRHKELRLVQNQYLLLNPEVEHKADPWP